MGGWAMNIPVKGLGWQDAWDLGVTGGCLVHLLLPE